ncbi:MAG: sigma-70 family RNA polymerase sigma factor [Deltaproteobacteria bacterium]|nr:sigma-70 family RNA polymerase sigma factor [Deltaproteobacteria bacterium]
MIENNTDTVSISNLVEDYGRLVSSICRRMIQDEETARDAAQEAWLEITKSLHSFRGGSKISTWIYTITYRAVMHYAKKEKVYSAKYVRDYFSQEEIKLPCSQDLDKRLWVKQMCDKCLTGVLYCLNHKSRMAYILRDIARLSYEEIADVLEHSPVSVRQMISRSRKKLQNFLKDECILHNTKGKCSCRMRKWVIEIDLVREYQELTQSIAEVNVFRETEEIISRVNYWRQFLYMD